VDSEQTASRGSGKQLLGNLVLALVVLACSFAAAELAVRLLYKNKTVLFPRYHTDYRYGNYTIRGIRPNVEFWHTSVDGTWKFVTNSRGFRSTREFTYAKPANTLRVLSLGDSHTQGYEVHQDLTFSAVLERYLKHRKINTEAINTGVSGFSTAEELVLLENEGVKYNPDVVVLGFFANDFEDNLKAGLFGLDAQNRLVEKKYEYVPGVGIQNFIYAIPGVPWLSENSYFYSLLFNNVWNYFKQLLADSARKQAASEGETPTATAAFEYAVPTGAPISESQIALTAALIERMHKFCEDRGIRFILVDIPTLNGPYRYQSSLPPALVERLTKARIEYISSQDLLKDFDGTAEMHRLHGDHHITEFTHTLLGAELGKRLLTSRTVKAH
jgi:GDSL-like lipase/acylhydrolase family protein